MTVRKLCPNNIPSPTREDSADWCDLAAGHTGVHRARNGRTWTDEDQAKARSLDSVNTLEGVHEPVVVMAAAEAGIAPQCSCGQIVWCALDTGKGQANG